MPVVTCPKCPARLKVPDGAKGNAKCPKCGAVVPLAAPPASAFEVVDAPPAAPRPARPSPAKKPADDESDFDFAHEDEKPKKRAAVPAVDDDDEDDRPRDKKKKRIEDDEDDEPRTRKKKRAYAEDDRDDDEDEQDGEDERPRRKSKKNRDSGNTTLLLIGLIGVFSLLLIGGGLAWYFWPSKSGGDGKPAADGGGGGSGKPTPDTAPVAAPFTLDKYMPDNAQVVAVLNVEGLLASNAYKQIHDAYPTFEKDSQFEAEAGLTSKDITSVQVGTVESGKDQELVATVRTNKAVTAPDILAKLKGEKYKPETVGRYTMYVREMDAFCVADSKVVLYGDTATLRKVLQRDKEPTVSAGMRAALKEVDFTKTFAVAVNAKDLLAAKPAGNPGNNGMGGPFGGMDQLLKNVEVAGGWVDVKSDIGWKFNTIFKDGTSAADAKIVFDAAIQSVKNQKILPPEFTELIGGLNPKVNGSRIELQGTLDTPRLLKVIKAFK